VFRRIALAHPDLEFSLRHNGRASSHLRKQPISERAASVLGREFVDSSVVVERRPGRCGCMGSPARRRRRAIAPTCIISSSTAGSCATGLLAHAAREAWRELLHGERQPAYLLFLELDPRGVDVNVHPGEDRGAVSRRPGGASVRPARSRPRTCAKRRGSSGCVSGGRVRDLRRSAGVPAAVRGGATGRRLPVVRRAASQSAAPLPLSASAPPLGYALAQLHGVYILAQNEPGSCSSTCTPRTSASSWRTSGSRSTRARCSASACSCRWSSAPRRSTIATAEENSQALESLGLEVSVAGPNELAVRAAPVLLANGDIAGLVRGVLAELREFGAAQVLAARRDELLAGMACHAACARIESSRLPR
jgi:DNA mismatch repair protein MutL